MKTRFVLEGEQKFRSAMSEAASSMKVLNSEQKLAQAQFKQTGDAQKYASDQARILKEKIQQQEKAVKAAEQAIKQMTDNGVDKNNKKMQQWQQKLNTAQTELVKMQTDLQKVTGEMSETTRQTDKMNDSLDAIGKKVSFDAVISGVDRITGAMKTAMSTAKNMAVALTNAMKDAAAWSDDLATESIVYGMSTSQLQRMRYTADLIDTSVEAIVKSQQKLNNNIGKGNKETYEALNSLHVSISEVYGKDMDIVRRKDPTDLFWEAGKAILKLEDAYEQEAKAQAIFGRGWKELLPLFDNDWAMKGYGSARDYYEHTMASWDVVSDENVSKLNALDDAIQKVNNQFETLKGSVFANLAPGFERIANALTDLLASFNKYLDTDEGKEKMQGLADAVDRLFSGLSDIEFGDAIGMVSGAINGMTDGLLWLEEHGEAVGNGIKLIAGGFLALKTASWGLKIAQLADGIKNLFKGGGNAAAKAAETAASGSGPVATAVRGGSSLAAKLYSLDPSGTSALIAPYLLDHTAGGRALRDGGTVQEAAQASWENIKTYFTETLPKNAKDFWETSWWGEIFEGYKDALIETAKNFDNYMDNFSASNSSVLGQNGGNLYQEFEKLLGVDTISIPEEEQKVRKLIDLSENWGVFVKRWTDYFGVNTVTAATGSTLGSPTSPLNIVKKLADGGLRTGSGGVSVPGIMDLSGAWGNFVQRWNDYFSTNNNLTAATEPELAEDAAEQLQEEVNAAFGTGAASKITFVARPKPSEDAADKLSSEIGVVPVTVQPIISAGAMGGASTGAGWAMLMQAAEWGGMIGLRRYANGLSSVPFDGYPAILDRGERVVPAREVESRSYNSNLYVEKMYMNNGTDAQGLASAMAAAQRRRMSGYGS